jgi:hypothetical protein
MSINCDDIKKILQNLMNIKCDETVKKKYSKAARV